MNDRVLSLLGLAENAGRIAAGSFLVEKAVKEGKAFFVIIAEDASDRSKKTCLDMCRFYKIPNAVYSDKESLGHSVGKEERSVVALLDRGFAQAVDRQLKIRTEKGR